MNECKCVKEDVIKAIKENIERNEKRLNAHSDKIDIASLDVRGMKVQLESISQEIKNISMMIQSFFKESNNSNNKTWENVFNKGYDLIIKLLAILGFILGMKEFFK